MVILDTPTKVLMSGFLVATFVMNMNNQSSRIPLLNYKFMEKNKLIGYQAYLDVIQYM